MNCKAPCSHFSATRRGIWSWGASEKWNDSWRSYDDKAEEWYQEYLKYKAQERQGPPDCCCYTFPCPTSEYDLAKRTSSTFGMFRDESRQIKLRGRNRWQQRYSRHSCQQCFVIHRLLKCSFCAVTVSTISLSPELQHVGKKWGSASPGGFTGLQKSMQSEFLPKSFLKSDLCFLISLCQLTIRWHVLIKLLWDQDLKHPKIYLQYYFRT